MRKFLILLPLLGACLWGIAREDAPADTLKADTQVATSVDSIGDNLTATVCEDSLDWYLHHYPCRLDISNFPKVTEAFRKLGIEIKDGWVDLSYCTQYFNHEAEGGDGPCLRGRQVTCNDIFFELQEKAKTLGDDGSQREAE